MCSGHAVRGIGGDRRVEQRLLDQSIAGLEGDHAGEPPAVVPDRSASSQCTKAARCPPMSVISTASAGRLCSGPRHERLDSHLVVAGVELAAQTVLRFRRVNPVPEYHHADRDNHGTGRKRIRVGGAHHRRRAVVSGPAASRWRLDRRRRSRGWAAAPEAPPRQPPASADAADSRILAAFMLRPFCFGTDPVRGVLQAAGATVFPVLTCTATQRRRRGQ